MTDLSARVLKKQVSYKSALIIDNREHYIVGLLFSGSDAYMDHG